jgi:hypothetical protein
MISHVADRARRLDLAERTPVVAARALGLQHGQVVGRLH